MVISTFFAASEPENCRATGVKVPRSDSIIRSKLDRFPWSGRGHRKRTESNEKYKREHIEKQEDNSTLSIRVCCFTR